MNKKPILIGKNFSSRSNCIRQIEKTLTALKSNNVINIRSADTRGYAFTIAKTESIAFKSLEQASDGLAYLKETVGAADRFTVSFDTVKEKEAVKRMMAYKKPSFDLTQVSKTKKAGFELIDKSKINLFYFHFNDAKGKPFLYSRAYDGKTIRTKAAKKLIKAINAKNQLVTDIVSSKEGVFAMFKGQDGVEIARSRLYKKRNKLEKAIAYFKKESQGKIKILKLTKKKKKKKTPTLPKEKYLLKQKAPLEAVGFEGFRNTKNKLHYFHYYDTKGLALLFSPPFTSRKLRDKAIQTAIQLSKDKRLYDMKKKAEQHYFILVNREGKGVARSRFFESEAAMIKGMRHLHANARTYDERSNIVTVPTTETIVIKLDETPTLKPNKADKDKNSQKQAPKLKPSLVATKSALTATNGVAEKKNNTTLKKTPTDNRPPIAKTPTTTAKDANKPIPNKPKVAPVDKTKKPNRIKNTPAKPPSSRKTQPPLKEVEKTPRVSTNTQAHKRPPTNKNNRNSSFANKAIDVEKEIPPRIPPRSEEQATINWWWVPVILVAALLLYGLFKLLSGFMLTENSTAPVAPIKKEIVQPVEKLPTLLGPTATELGFEKGSLSARITDFLSLPASILPKTFLLDKVNFPFNQEVLTVEAQGQLDRIVQILKAYPTVNIQVNGHTDNVGNANRNLLLSQSRATIVNDYLKAKGVVGDRTSSKGFGADRPIKSNETEEGRQANRRSEIVLLKR